MTQPTGLVSVGVGNESVGVELEVTREPHVNVTFPVAGSVLCIAAGNADVHCVAAARVFKNSNMKTINVHAIFFI